jgi:soluble lytic murein transglycosylase-like protein
MARAWMLATSLSVADLEPVHAAELAQNDREIPRAIEDASLRFGVPTAWIGAVIAAESAGDRQAVSVKGAMGLMQLMPGTWRDLRADLGLGADPFNARDNISAGTAYLRRLLDRFGPRGFLAAYNAGPARYQDFMAGTRRLPSETVAYVARVEAQVVGQDEKSHAEHAVKPRDWRVSDLFPGQDGGGEHEPTVAEATGLFVETGQGGRP